MQTTTEASPLPLRGYATLMAAFGVLFGPLLAGAAMRGRLPRKWRAGDVLVLGVATHKLARLLTKDRVTAPLRAPFARFEEGEGAGEVRESSRGTGLQRAVGDLVTCPFCSAPWVASALAASFVAAPRATRAIAAVLGAVTVSDFLQHVYGRAKS